jgi:multicomponent Na+:H+ antiporter subunit F
MSIGLTAILILGAFSILLAALVLALISLIRSPETSNMIVALDLIAFIVMGYILVFSVVTGKGIYFDIAIVIALISFMGTVALSNYLKDQR